MFLPGTGPVLARRGGTCQEGFLLLVLALMAPSVQGVELELSGGYVHEQTSNVLRTPEPIRDSIRTARLLGSVRSDDDTLSAELVARLEYRDYLRDNVADETTGNIDGRLDWRIKPQRVSWMVEERLRSVSSDPLAAETPANREHVNVLVTGPDVRLGSGRRSGVDLAARLTDVRYSDTPASSVRQSGTARWWYQLTPGFRVATSGEFARTDYRRDDLNPDYARVDGYVSALLERPLSRLTLDAGATTIERRSEPDQKGNVARFGWEYRMTQATSVNLQLTREFGDTTSDVLAQAEQDIEPDGGLVATGDVAYVKRARFGVLREVRGGSLSGYFERSSRDYDRNDALDQDRHEGAVRVGLVLQPRLMGTLNGLYRRYEYLNTGREDVDREVAAGVRYLLRPDVSISIEARRRSRTSTVPASRYDENRYMLSILVRG